MELSHDYKSSILRNRKVDPDKEKKMLHWKILGSGQILFPITVENCCKWFGYPFNKNKNRSICLSNSFFSTAIVSCIEKPLKKRLPFDRSENRTKKKIEVDAMCESERHTGRLEIPKSLPKRDHCIFYRARGIARGFTGPPRIESPRAFYHPVAAGVTPADPRFSFLFAARDEPRRSSILRVSSTRLRWRFSPSTEC